MASYEGQGESGWCAGESTATPAAFQKQCACCYKPLGGDYEPYIEYLYKFYHNECFRCHVCLKSFSCSASTNNTTTPPSSSVSSLSEDAMSIVINKYGQLVCLRDYIENLKCQICMRNFDMSSKIHHLKNPEEDESTASKSPSFSTASSNCTQMTARDDDLLVHADCVKCDQCLAPIDVSCEYAIKKRRVGDHHISGKSVVGAQFALNCRSCALRGYQASSSAGVCRPPEPGVRAGKVVKKQHKHRLSSRQKEMLVNELILNNNNADFEAKNLCENEKFICGLAKEIRCSPKALLDYISKHKLSNRRNSGLTSQQLFLNKQALEAASQGKSITNMLEQLNKIDRILAPNRCPFDNDANSNDAEEQLGPALLVTTGHQLCQHPSLVRS